MMIFVGLDSAAHIAPYLSVSRGYEQIFDLRGRLHSSLISPSLS